MSSKKFTPRNKQKTQFYKYELILSDTPTPDYTSYYKG